MTFERTIRTYKNLIERSLAAQVRAVRAHALRDAVAHVVGAGGKRIRPLLTMLACEAAGGNARDAVPAAVAVELLHTFTLVHDDIMDNASLRRGVPTVHAKWNTNVAILAGDTIAALALESLARVRSRNAEKMQLLFADAFRDVCIGQALDNEMETGDADRTKYLTMIGAKTAAIFSMSAALGGYIGTVRDATIGALAEFGKELGVAFQIRDDALDVAGDDSTLGKDSAGDIREGKKTFLYIEAVRAASAAELPLLQKYAARKGLRGKDVPALIGVYRRTGAIARAEREIRRHTLRAITCVETLPAGTARANLIAMADMLTARAF